MHEAPDGHETAARPRLRELSVPEDLYEEVIDFIAERRRAKRSHSQPRSVERDEPADERADSEADVAPGADEHEQPGWDADSLRQLLDHANGKLVRALVALARSPNQQLLTEELIEAANSGETDPNKRVKPGRPWGGFLSRAQASSRHRFNDRDLPIHYLDHDDGQNKYGIDPEEADLIRRWAEQSGRF